MAKRRMWRLLALLFAFSLVAAACGGGDDDSDSGAAETETETTAASSDDDEMAEEEMEEEEEQSSLGGAASEEDIEAAVAGETDEEDAADDMADEEMMEFDRSTLQGIFDEAAFNRQITIDELTAKIEAGEYGVGDDGILRGPSGFEIDMNECPADWSNTTGITDSQVRIGHTTAQSGNLAAYGNIAYGWQNYLDWINANDPIMVGDSSRELMLVVKDDAYVAAQTIEFVDELIEAENVFAILTLGSPNTLAVYDKINSECIPHPFVMTGHPAWGDPVNHPWTTGMQLSYSTEAILWGSWIKQNLPDILPVKVAGLVMDNDFGLAYELGFDEWAAANPDVVSEYRPVRHDPAAPTLTNEMTTISAFEPDVFISMTAGNPCLLAIQEAGASGLLDDIRAKGGALFTPSVCKSIEAYMKPAGDAANAWWIVGGGGKDSTDPKYVDEPFVSFVNQNLEDGDLDPKVSLYAVGYTYGYPYGESLRIAAELPGGLTRTNFILAARSIDIYHPLLLDGMSAEMDGNADSYFVEGSDFSQFDSNEQTWNIIGAIVDVNGKSSNCAWDKDNGGCR